MNVPFPDPLVHFAPIRGSERQPVGAVVKPSVRFLHSRRGNRQCSSTMRPHDGPNRSTRNPGNRLFLQMTAPVGSVLARATCCRWALLAQPCGAASNKTSYHGMLGSSGTDEMLGTRLATDNRGPWPNPINRFTDVVNRGKGRSYSAALRESGPNEQSRTFGWAGA